MAMRAARDEGQPNAERRMPRRRAKGRRGFATEEVLITAALLACFVLPVAAASRVIGKRLAQQMDHAERVILTR